MPMTDAADADGPPRTGRPADPEVAADPVVEARLTPRQQSVLDLSRQGMAPVEIARTLGLSGTVVRDCLAQIRRKVALARRRAQAGGPPGATGRRNGGPGRA
jgi:DNA-binding CsgD family transcriptional regulator